jgi:hypothetical protein
VATAHNQTFQRPCTCKEYILGFASSSPAHAICDSIHLASNKPIGFNLRIATNGLAHARSLLGSFPPVTLQPQEGSSGGDLALNLCDRLRPAHTGRILRTTPLCPAALHRQGGSFETTWSIINCVRGLAYARTSYRLTSAARRSLPMALHSQGVTWCPFLQ